MSKYWGYHLRIELGGMDHDKITNADSIKEYLIKLCDVIKMKRHGEPQVIHFGDTPEVSGFSFLQWILTSNIVGHTVDASDEGYIDVFSCSPFDPSDAVDFTSKFFDTGSYIFDFKARQAPYPDEKYADPVGSD